MEGRYFLSLLLLFVLGANLIEDISFMHSMTDQIENQDSVSKTPATDFVTSQNFPCGNEESDDSHHSSMCHFGHCTHLALSEVQPNFPKQLSSMPVINDSVGPKAPFLEGLRRPPRIS